MAKYAVLFLYVALAADVKGQLFDYFQHYQPYIQNYATQKPAIQRRKTTRTETVLRTRPSSRTYYNESPKSFSDFTGTDENGSKRSYSESGKTTHTSHRTRVEQTIIRTEKVQRGESYSSQEYGGERKGQSYGSDRDGERRGQSYGTDRDGERKGQSYGTDRDGGERRGQSYGTDRDGGGRKSQSYGTDRDNNIYYTPAEQTTKRNYNQYETSQSIWSKKTTKNPWTQVDVPNNGWPRKTTKAPWATEPIIETEDWNRRPRPEPTRGQDWTERPRPEYERPRPDRWTTQSPTNQRPDWTTQGPINQRPLESFPPITNKPPTRRPSNYDDSEDVITFPGQFGHKPRPTGDGVPEVVIGIDEDSMGSTEKRRYIELAERMCDKYKALNVEKVSAIPLVPEPMPFIVNVSKCAPANVPLVVGGKIASIQEFPHMALLGWTNNEGGGYSWKCGGSLISDQFVLTAAHCSYQERDNTVVTGPPRAVQLGSSYLDDPGAIVLKIERVIKHPKYKLPKSYYDIALLKLRGKVTFSERIKPACLGIPPPVDKPIIATGWGRTEFGGIQSQELRSVSLPVWGLEECHRALGTSRKLPQGPSADSQMCAGERAGGKDTCQGDSGGPAQIQDGCQWRVVAVTSLGRSCGAKQTPGLYATVQRAFVSAVVFGGR